MSRPRSIPRLAIAACFASLVVSLASCSSGYTTADPSVVLYVVVNASTNFVGVGDTLQLTATAYNGNNIVVGGVNFSWYSSDTNLATVDSSGLARGIAPGTPWITAGGGGQVIGQMWLPVVQRDGG